MKPSRTYAMDLIIFLTIAGWLANAWSGMFTKPKIPPADAATLDVDHLPTGVR
ncbi:MAG: hypothetical protein GXP36_00105 [Actinobacteria bacterium]|nr:hypothetical protein [Actinomycetota bacterium]